MAAPTQQDMDDLRQAVDQALTQPRGVLKAIRLLEDAVKQAHLAGDTELAAQLLGHDAKVLMVQHDAPERETLNVAVTHETAAPKTVAVAVEVRTEAEERAYRRGCTALYEHWFNKLSKEKAGA